MIIKAKHHFIVYPFFKKYAVWIIKRNFNNVKLIGSFKDENKPVLLILNHTSWWDGFWAMYLNVMRLKRKFHFMMLEEQLNKYWFFRYTGGFSVHKKKRSMVFTLNYSNELLKDSKNMVLLFPQGEIQSMHQQQFLFQKGIERILGGTKDEVQILFAAAIIDYFSSKKPSLTIFFENYDLGLHDLKSIQQAYNLFYEKCLETQKELKS